MSTRIPHNGSRHKYYKRREDPIGIDMLDVDLRRRQIAADLAYQAAIAHAIADPDATETMAGAIGNVVRRIDYGKSKYDELLGTWWHHE